MSKGRVTTKNNNSNKSKAIRRGARYQSNSKIKWFKLVNLAINPQILNLLQNKSDSTISKCKFTEKNNKKPNYKKNRSFKMKEMKKNKGEIGNNSKKD